MLEFIDDKDFSLVNKYKLQDDGTVLWTYQDGESFHSGHLREGMTRTIQVQDGTKTEQVVVGSEDGQDILEEKPVMIDRVIDIWAKLQSKMDAGSVIVEGKTAAEIEAEMIADFKLKREKLIEEGSVTISTGKTFSTRKRSLDALNHQVTAHLSEPDDVIIMFSTEDVGTGIMVECTKAEIKEAYKAVVDFITNIWAIDNE